MLLKKLGADLPLEMKVFHQKTCNNHACSIVHPAGLNELSHRRIHDWVSRGASFPGGTVAHQFLGGSNGTSKGRRSNIGRIIALAIRFINVQVLRLTSGQVGPNPLDSNLAEEKSPQVPVFSFQQGGRANITTAFGQAESQVLGVNDCLRFNKGKVL